MIILHIKRCDSRISNNDIWWSALIDSPLTRPRLSSCSAASGWSSCFPSHDKRCSLLIPCSAWCPPPCLPPCHGPPEPAYLVCSPYCLFSHYIHSAVHSTHTTNNFSALAPGHLILKTKHQHPGCSSAVAQCTLHTLIISHTAAHTSMTIDYGHPICIPYRVTVVSVVIKGPEILCTGI